MFNGDGVPFCKRRVLEMGGGDSHTAMRIRFTPRSRTLKNGRFTSTTAEIGRQINVC